MSKVPWGMVKSAWSDFCPCGQKGNDEMSDTYTLQYQNFRSLRDAKIDIAPLTVIYGSNGSGKSSMIYGLLTLRNFLTNPNQNGPSLFSYFSIGLGGWQNWRCGDSAARRGQARANRTSYSVYSP